MADWTGRTATEIAAAVRAGEATAGQVVAGHLDRIGDDQPAARIRRDVVESAQVGVVGTGLPARAEFVICQQRHDPRHLVAPRVPEDQHAT